eukprot:6198728-Alexandrium_andersonii.AAC.1
MVAQQALQLYAYASKGVLWLLEQPRGSPLEAQPRFQGFVRVVREKLGAPVYRICLNMGWYGAESQKPTWIYTMHRRAANITKYAT